MHKRTGLRRPINFLKTWGDVDWTRRLTPRLSVGMVDEDLPPTISQRKSWYITLTQGRDLLKELGPVHGTPRKGKTLLLFEDDVIALVQHLADAGLVTIADDGITVTNGKADEWESDRQLRRQHGKRRRKA